MVVLLVRRRASCAIGRFHRGSGLSAGALLDRGATLKNRESLVRLQLLCLVPAVMPRTRRRTRELLPDRGSSPKLHPIQPRRAGYPLRGPNRSCLPALDRQVHRQRFLGFHLLRLLQSLLRHLCSP
jgi:hypothetical protein